MPQQTSSNGTYGPPRSRSSTSELAVNCPGRFRHDPNSGAAPRWDHLVRSPGGETRQRGKGFWIDTAIVAIVVLVALVAHLSEIALGAVIFLLSGEFVDIGTAYYHSAFDFTTLGYGDLILSPRWRLLGPLEAADGMLMFGVSTAMTFTLIQRLAEARFAGAERLRSSRSRPASLEIKY